MNNPYIDTQLQDLHRLVENLNSRLKMPILPTGTELKVCNDITDRQRLGIAKYGTTVEQNPLTLKEWLTHAYEECLDQAVYLKRAIEELEK